MKKFLSFMLAISILTSTTMAVTTKDKLDQTQSEIKGIQSQKNENKAEQKNLLNELDNIGSTINTTERQISKVENEIKELEESIVITEENIKFSQEQYDEKYELRKNRVVAYYKNGSISLQDIVDKAQSSTERLVMQRIVNEITEYDMALMEELEEEKQQLEAQKIKLEEDSIRCANLKDELEVKLAELNDTKEIRTQYLSKLEKDLNALNQAEDELNAEAKRLQKELEEQAKKSANTPYVGGKMVWPLPGHYVITSSFGNRLHPVLKVYKLHTGVDIAGAGCNGDPVVAAAAGTVIKATYSKAYGNYIIIDHGGGITTLYAHSSKLLVKAGDKVSAGQEIMKVGTTGYSTGPHLHFEVRENGTYVDPIGKGYIKH